MNLYQINDRIEELTSRLIDVETGEIDEAVMDELEKLDIERESKLEGCGIVIKSLRAEIEALTSEVEMLNRRRRVKLNKMQRLADYVASDLKGEAFETSKVAYTFRKSQKVDVRDEEAIPDELCRFETKRLPRKDLIKKIIKDGNDVPGCVLIDTLNLQVK